MKSQYITNEMTMQSAILNYTQVKELHNNQNIPIKSYSQKILHIFGILELNIEIKIVNKGNL